MQRIKRKNGITLVALIITIIVLLILAGVSLSFVFNGGILDKSQQAVNEYENASQIEQGLLDKIDKYLENELGEIANDEVPIVDEDGLATEDTTIVAKDDPSIQIVIPEGFAPAILQTGTTQSLPGENGAVKEIMPADQWNNITKEDINRGIVVIDNKVTYDGGQSTGSVSDFNEYVWISIPDMSKFKRVAWTVINSEGINITDSLSEISTKDAYWEETSSTEYINMVDSINNNKGFYIGRYEASKKNNDIAQSKRNQTVWTDVTQVEAINISKNTDIRLNSHLMYGIEWDSVFNWLIGNAIISSSINDEFKTMDLKDIQTDSRSWGNYKNSIGNANNISGTKQVTGISEYWKANNIYDLAGNFFELTQEIYSDGTIRVQRSGSYKHEGETNNNSAASRGRNFNTSHFDDIRI